ncbi:hypothetical protein GCM10010442_14190 [Kitasatospora kifunensis]
MDWCLGCASATVYRGDPIDCYEELTPAAAAYSQLLTRRSFSRRDPPKTPFSPRALAR